MKIMFSLLLVMCLFTPNTYKATTPVIIVNIRKVKDPDCFTCKANIKQEKAEVNMIANEHVSYSSDKNFILVPVILVASIIF